MGQRKGSKSNVREGKPFGTSENIRLMKDPIV